MYEKLFFLAIGQGNPLICLHGYALDHSIWIKMAEEIKSKVRLVLPDLRGHGKSPAPAGKYTMRIMAEDVLKLMDDQGIDCACVAGHSMGGYIALALAEFYPDRISGLAMVASHSFKDLPETKKSRIEDIEKIRNHSVTDVLSKMTERLSRNPRIADYCRTLISKSSKNGIVGVLGGMAERPDRTHILRSLKSPKLVIAGADDQFITLETSKKMAEMVKGLTIIEIENAGHVPMLEKPHETGFALMNLFN